MNFSPCAGFSPLVFLAPLRQCCRTIGLTPIGGALDGCCDSCIISGDHVRRLGSQPYGFFPDEMLETDRNRRYTLNQPMDFPWISPMNCYRICSLKISVGTSTPAAPSRLGCRPPARSATETWAIFMMATPQSSSMGLVDVFLMGCFIIPLISINNNHDK